MLDRSCPRPDALNALTAQAHRDLEMLRFASRPWVMPVVAEGTALTDVVIIGAGQSGLAAGFELKRRGVERVVLLDANPEGYEGVWQTYARNYEIRSPKDITGLEGGIPSLTIEAYCRAAHGDAVWEAMLRVPRHIWMDYLRWFRTITGLEIRNNTRVEDIAYDADGVTLTLQDKPAMRCRTVVLATGMEGGGYWSTPSIIKDNLPREVWNHSADIFDETKLKGKRVAVVGGGAAAFDMAVTALDAGAKSVDMLLRRNELPMRDVVRELEISGYMVHANQLSDMQKWEISSFMAGLSQAPAEHHYHKACAYENFNISLGSGLVSLSYQDGEIALETPRKVWKFDHLFSATGVWVDMTSRPELAKIAEKAALWRDRFTPPGGPNVERRLNFPYLDSHYRFTPRVAGEGEGIDRIYAFNTLAGMSLGGVAAVSIGAFRFGVRRLVDGITERLFLEQADQLLPYLQGYDKPGATTPPNMQAKLDREMAILAGLETAQV